MKRLIIIFLLFYNGSLFAADNFLPPFTVNYKLYARGLPVGEGSRTLTPLKNGQFSFSSSSHTTGLLAVFRDDQIEERSLFSLVNGQVRPIEYHYHQTGSKKQKHVQIQFDWKNQVARNLIKDQTWEVPLETGVLDNLVYQLVLMQELAQGKTELTYKIASGGKIKVYQPTLLGKEQLNTEIGKLDVVKYEYVADNEKRRITAWCAPSLRYLPVRVEYVEKQSSDTMSLVLKSVQGLEISK